MSNEDVITGEILPDGTLKLITDPISPANHSSADKFFHLLGELSGGSLEKTRRSKHIHEHVHEHVTEHEHNG